MSKKPTTQQQLLTENTNLRARLEKAEQTLRDMLSGEADGLLVPSAAGTQLFALKDADQSYRALIENMGEGALAITPEGLILYSNRRFAAMLGAPLEKVIGSDIHNWFAPESRQILQMLLQKETIENHREELALSASDGTPVPVYLSVNRQVLDGTPDLLYLVITDLTKQKRNEAMLADERFARAILEQAADVIVICDGNGQILRANRKAQAFYSKNLQGELFMHVFPLRRLDGTPFSFIGSVEDDSNQSVEMTLQYDGQGFDFLVSVGHLKGARDDLLGSVVTMTDITDRKTQELALRTSEKQLSEALTIARIGYWEYETATDEFIFNDQYYLLHKITAKEAGGYRMSAADFARRYVHTDDASTVGKNLQLALESRDPAYSAMTETRILTGEGAIVWVEVRFRIQKDSQGNTIYLFGVNQDITERKKEEARIKYLNRVYAMLSGINSLIVRAKDRTELFREACRIAVKGGGFRMAMLFIIDQHTKKIVPVSSAGEDMELLADIKNLLLSGGDEANTMIGRAIGEKKVVISNDSVNDPQVLLGKKCSEFGICSMIDIPLIVDGEAVGVLALYAKEIDFFQEDEVSLLTELAGDIAFAIDHIDKQERLDYLAYYDELTGLANRSLFLDRVSQYMHSAVTGRHKLALCQVDLERFKSINDSLGRNAGDELLKQVAEWLRLNVGDVNTLARIDTDHFALVMPKVRDDGDLGRLITKTMAAFSRHQFRMNDAMFRINAKVGIALFPDDGSEADILLRNAEAALKKAKLSGDRYLFHTQKMTQSVAHKLSMENQLRQAIDNEEFVLYYQPKVNISNRKVESAEALIRWNKPEAGLIPPGDFIPILEETGLIHEVGRWALRKAIMDNLLWREAGLTTVRIAVNISAIQLRNPVFIDEIKEVITISPHAASGLELEITESLIMEDVKHNIETLQAIRALGITIAIDDFGTGFSSLSYLARLPVDTLKIDRSFIIDMTVGPEGLALVSTIINLAHSMNLKVVAEGVEAEEQSHLLHLLKCDEMQGFLFSKPVPGEIFQTKFLAPQALNKKE